MGKDRFVDNDDSDVRVVLLGAICELDDLASQPSSMNRSAGLAESTRSIAGNPSSEKAGRSFFSTIPREMMQAKREEWLESGRIHFQLKEFADLSNGRRVFWRHDRGWVGSCRESRDSTWKLVSGRELTRQTMLVLEPDDDSQWVEEMVEELAQVCGVKVDPDSVQAAPFRVEFGPRLQRELLKRKPPS